MRSRRAIEESGPHAALIAEPSVYRLVPFFDFFFFFTLEVSKELFFASQGARIFHGPHRPMYRNLAAVWRRG